MNLWNQVHNKLWVTSIANHIRSNYTPWIRSDNFGHWQLKNHFSEMGQMHQIVVIEYLSTLYSCLTMAYSIIDFIFLLSVMDRKCKIWNSCRKYSYLWTFYLQTTTNNKAKMIFFGICIPYCSCGIKRAIFWLIDMRCSLFIERTTNSFNILSSYYITITSSVWHFDRMDQMKPWFVSHLLNWLISDFYLSLKLIQLIGWVIQL